MKPTKPEFRTIKETTLGEVQDRAEPILNHPVRMAVRNLALGLGTLGGGDVMAASILDWPERFVDLGIVTFMSAIVILAGLEVGPRAAGFILAVLHRNDHLQGVE